MNTTPNPTSERPIFTHAEISCLFIALTQMRSVVHEAVSRGQFAKETAEALAKAISVCTIQPIDAHRNMFRVVDWGFSLQGMDVSTPTAAQDDLSDAEGSVSR